MKTTETQQWFYLLMYTVCGLVVFGIFYLLAVVLIQPAKDVRDYYAGVVGFTEKYIGQTPVVLPPPGSVYADFHALKVNESIAIEPYQVIYRGPSNGGGFKLDVADTRLDSKTFYSYAFDRPTAEMGIRIGQYRFRVLSARPAILHLQRIRK